MDYGSWTITKLREELKRRFAKISGRKEVLIQRLIDYDRNDNFIPVVEMIVTDEPGLQWPADDSFKSVSTASVVPKIDIVHVNEYFLGVHEHGKSMYSSVHRKGYAMVLENFLCALAEFKAENHHFFRGQVNSEITKSLTYFVKLAINCDGDIIEGNCECIAGKGIRAGCKHVAVLSYALLKFRESNVWPIRKTCTDVKQTWHMPKKSRVELSPRKAEDLLQTIPIYGIQKRNIGKLSYDPRPPCRKNEPFYDSTVKNSIVNFTSSRKRSLSMSGVLEVASLPGIYNDHDYLEYPLHYYMIYDRIKVSESEAATIEKNTRSQSKSELWIKERSWRITASNVGTIVHMTWRRNKEQFAEDLVSNRRFHSAAINWGKNNEKHAIAAYEKVSGNKVVSCGLFIALEHPFLASSPDGLISQNTVLEVKCPYSIRNEVISSENLDYLEILEGKLCLKKNNNYYFQVQTQMFTTNRKLCDFVVWTSCDLKIISIIIDDKAIKEKIIPLSQAFYDEHVIRTLAKKFYQL